APGTAVYGMTLPVLTELGAASPAAIIAVTVIAAVAIVAAVASLVAVIATVVTIIAAITRRAVDAVVALLDAPLRGAGCTTGLREGVHRHDQHCAGRECNHESLHVLPPAGGPLRPFFVS